MTNLTQRVAEALALAEKATPGKWCVWTSGGRGGGGPPKSVADLRIKAHMPPPTKPFQSDTAEICAMTSSLYEAQSSDAAFIAHAPEMANLIRDLHAENERLRKELAIAQALHKSTWSMAACRVRGYLIQGDWDVDTCLAIEAEFQERAR